MRIELRWYRYESWEGLPEWEDIPTIITELQWRQEEGPRGESWWGEWKPVPLVDDTHLGKKLAA